MKMNLDDWGIHNPYNAQLQVIWRQRAANPAYPLWLRIGFLALGTHRRNLHSTFGEGELVELFGKPRSDISHAIARAKREGWLTDESCARCLVVPSVAVRGGLGGDNAPCPYHHHHDAARNPFVLTSSAVLRTLPELRRNTPSNGALYARD